MSDAIYMPRSAWTSTAAAGESLTGGKLRGVAIHWPGSTQDVVGDPGSEKIAARLRSYRDYHLSRGWRDIGYNFAADQAGRFWMLRSTTWRGNLIGAHCASSGNPDGNEEYVGVLLLIGDVETPSAKMTGAVAAWFRDRFLPGWPNRIDVRGHGQVAGASTECPGSRARALISSGAFTATTKEDDLPFTEAQLRAIIREEVGKEIDEPRLRTGTLPDSSDDSNVRPSDGGRYAWFANRYAQHAVKRLDAVIARLDHIEAELHSHVAPPIP